MLAKWSDIKLLNTIEKALLLEQSGLNNLVIHPLTKSFRINGEEFVKDILVDVFNIKKIGHDHRLEGTELLILRV
jgi:riboflavin kinase/FMN adenylyltransferase